MTTARPVSNGDALKNGNQRKALITGITGQVRLSPDDSKFDSKFDFKFDSTILNFKKETDCFVNFTEQDGSYLAELLVDKGYEVHGIIRRSSSFNTGRIQHLYKDPVIHKEGCK